MTSPSKKTIVRIQYPTAEVVVEVSATIFGDATRVAKRMRDEGLQAKRSGDDVLVNGSADFVVPHGD